MIRRLRLTVCFVLLLIVFAISCRPSIEWKGKVSGDFEVQTEISQLIEKGTASVTLDGGSNNQLKVGSELPLSECDLHFSPVSQGTGPYETNYELVNPDAIECKARVGKPGSPPVDVQVLGGHAKMTHKDVFSFGISYRSVNFNEIRNLVFKGTKSWF